MDEFKIDSHKLNFHVSRVDQWLKEGDTYPIYAEVAPAGACNHRCTFCALDYLDYKTQFIEKKALIKVLSDMAGCGLKSVMFAGEGEPLLHKGIVELVLHAKGAGLDTAITTNGVLLGRDMARDMLPALSWLRFSLNAGTAKTYSQIHRCNEGDFEKVLENIEDAVKVKRSEKSNCTIGAQFLLLRDNHKEAKTLAGLLKKIGVDYLIIKPYSPHPKKKEKLIGSFDYSAQMGLADELKKFSDSGFAVIFRAHAMTKLNGNKLYKKCLGLPFWTYIDSSGSIYACSSFLGDEKFCYGNIGRGPFREIWKGEKRKGVLDMFAKSFDISGCRKACRLDEVNRYLWELKHPGPHVNFI